MLEYCHDTTLYYLPETDLREWLAVARPHNYLLLLRSARVLAHCPTLLARNSMGPWLCDPDDRRVLNVEFGLEPGTTLLSLRRRLGEYLDEPWPLFSCTYNYDGQDYLLANVASARELWLSLLRIGLFTVVTVDPVTLVLACRPRYTF